ncbi:MAG: heme-binding domain-containing protein [Gemmatimonadota bacterium]|nr:heme-binding domain-containing protein [Gemmatimonadota bacterium]MDH3424274.1 heme-binding domain-containing protein [Gemmatimonadota bacterium]
MTEGREHLNFSTWDRPNHGLEEIIEVLEGG